MADAHEGMIDIDGDDDTDRGATGSKKDRRGKTLSERPEEEIYQTLMQWYLLDDEHSRTWREEECKLSFDFVAGDQWDQRAKDEVMGEKRVPLTYNVTLAFIKAVAGLEIGARHETVFLPQEVEGDDIEANELLSETSNWMGAQCDAEDEQTEVFTDSLICGMGWSDSRMDLESAEGDYFEEQIDPMEMRWDRAARKKNLKDSRRMWRVRKFTLDEAQEKFPDAEPEDLHASWAIGFDAETGQAKPIEERRMKLGDGGAPNDPRTEVHIVQVQWIERECFYRVAVQQPATQMGMPAQMVQQDVSERDYATLKADADEAGVKLSAVKLFKKRFMQAFLGSKVLEIGPCPHPDRFTLQCITGTPHRSKGTWFGLVKVMRDPQMNANKWMSQLLHILNTTAKGGIIAEEGSFKNIEDAKKTYASPSAITFAARGAVSKGQIMAKPGVGMGQTYFQLAQWSFAMPHDMVGVNLETMAMQDQNQAAQLDRQRKQSSMTMLGTFFDNLRNYRKQIGRIRLYFIQHYVPEGTIMRLKGKAGKFKAVRLIKDDKLMGKFDVIVSDAPSTTDQKGQTWVSIMQLAQMPQMEALLTPEVVVELLDYCPLPSKVVELLKKAVATPNPAKQMQEQIAQEGAKAQVREQHAKAEQGETAAGLNKAKTILTMADAEVKRQEAANKATERSMMPLIRTPGGGGSRPGALFPTRAAAQDADFEDITVPEPQGRELPAIPSIPMHGGPRPPSGMELLHLLASQGGGQPN